MVVIRRLSRNNKTYKGNKRSSGIRKIIHRIRKDGNWAENNSRKTFYNTQKYIADNSDDWSKIAVFHSVVINTFFEKKL